MVDAVGGVDVDVVQGFTDPTYDGYGLEGRGWSITAGPHHLDGRNALAFSRSRKAPGESDFTRALRQQQVIVALRDAVTKDGSLLWELPGLLDAVGDAVRTDLPPSRLPQLAAILDEIDDDSIARSVIGIPLVRPITRGTGRRRPDLVAIREVAAACSRRPAWRRNPGRRRSRRRSRADRPRRRPAPAPGLLLAPSAGRAATTPRTLEQRRRGPSTRTRARDGRGEEPSATARSSQASRGPSSRPGRAGRSAWRGARAAPTRRPRRAPRACPARRAAR